MSKSNLKLIDSANNDVGLSQRVATTRIGEHPMTEIEKRLTRLEVDNEYIKKDLSEIKGELKTIQKIQAELQLELKTDVANVKTDIANLRTDFQKDIQAQTKWIIATAIALVSLSLAAAKYLFS
ncbi:MULTISPECIES: hypothetical protein [unclassified Mannheimia]|uniref:hypothetical protein n=1 Tax=unclassified Mannheimia TaxID=2645054 RepID=UPI00359DE518